MPNSNKSKIDLVDIEMFIFNGAISRSEARCDRIKQPDGSLEITYYQTRLELTPSGKIRVEESCQQGSKTLTNNHRDLLPLESVKFISITPKTIERNYLYPRNKTKPKVKKEKPQQLKLPTTETEIILQEASFRNGDKQIKSVQDLYLGNGEIHSLNFGIIKIAQPLIILAKELNCSIDEWEAIAQMSLVLNPNQLLNFIQEIPNMRKIPELTKFQESANITETTSNTKQYQIQRAREIDKLL